MFKDANVTPRHVAIVHWSRPGVRSNNLPQILARGEQHSYIHAHIHTYTLSRLNVQTGEVESVEASIRPPALALPSDTVDHVHEYAPLTIIVVQNLGCPICH
jgi:hypothetical protein